MGIVMKQLLIIAIATLAVSGPAAAQNASEVARAERGVSCPGCNLFQANLSGVEARGLNFAGSRLRQADLSLSVLNRARFSNSDLRDVNAYGGVFSSANFSGANLTNASFVGSYVQGANFSGANLSSANFSGAEMSRARGLTQRQLNQACGDASTTLPGGLHIPAC